MIIVKLVDLKEVPYYSLNNWELHGTPIIKQSIYGSTEDYRGYKVQGTTINDVYQPMKKDLYIIKENEKEIKECLYDVFLNDDSYSHKAYYQLLNEIRSIYNIQSIEHIPDKMDAQQAFKIVWRKYE